MVKAINEWIEKNQMCKCMRAFALMIEILLYGTFSMCDAKSFYSYIHKRVNTFNMDLTSLSLSLTLTHSLCVW